MTKTMIAMSLALGGCGHGVFYAPATAQGNQCDNECMIAARSCQGINSKDHSACDADLNVCRERCWTFNGGEMTPKTLGFWESPPVQKKDPPGTPGVVPASAPAGQPSKGRP
jgi:hypothetical protein